MDQIAVEMNDTLKEKSGIFYSLLSELGKELYMPKGIIYQTAEANKHAHKFNATIGIATEKNSPMILPSLKNYFNNLEAQEIFNYVPSSGDPELRQEWMNKIIKQDHLDGSKEPISLPVVTNALTHGIMVASDLFINEDDEIVVPDKYWENYDLILKTRKKARFINYSLFNDDFTGFNVPALQKALDSSTKDKVVLIFNFPNNPTGYNPTDKEMEQIVAVVKAAADKGKKILVITDDAYYGLFYSDEIKESIFAKFTGCHPSIACVKVDGISKEDYAWGLRIGFITFSDYTADADAYRVLEKKATAAVRASISNCSRPIQSMLKKVLKEENYTGEKQQKYSILKTRAEKVKEIVYREEFKELWDVYPFNSGYFMCLKLKGMEAEAVRVRALQEYGVGTIAIGDRDLRVAFSCVELEQLEELFTLIVKACYDIKGQK